MDEKDKKIKLLKSLIENKELQLKEREVLLSEAVESLAKWTKKKNSERKRIAKLSQENKELTKLCELGFEAAKETTKHFSGEWVPKSLVKFHGICQKKFYASPEKIDVYK